MKIITFEGIEGVGKSTQIDLLANWLTDQNHTVEIYREPGSTKEGEMIRSILLDPNIQLDDISELLMMFAARSELVNQILSSSNASYILLDRYFHASIAYQGSGRGIPFDIINQLITIVRCPKPHLTFLLDLEVEKGFARKQSDSMDRIELSGLDFFNKVRMGYLELSKEYSYMKVIDADQNINQIHDEIINYINE